MAEQSAESLRGPDEIPTLLLSSWHATPQSDAALVDSTDLIIIASVVQTIVITLTLAVFIFQFRSQEKAIRKSSYQNVMGRYTDYIRMRREARTL